MQHRSHPGFVGLFNLVLFVLWSATFPSASGDTFAADLGPVSSPRLSAVITNTVTLTPTATRTSTPLASRTATATALPTPTATRAPTPLASRTPTATPIATPIPSPTRTFTRAAAATPTQTPRPTTTRTATASRTATATLSRTPTLSATATLTRTPTRTLTATVTRTATLNVTATLTGTPTVTATATLTRTPTLTPTATATAPRTVTTTLVVETDVDPVLGGELRVGQDGVVVQFPGGALSAAHRIRYEPTQPQAGQPRTNWKPILHAFTLRALEKANPSKETKQFKKPVTIRVRYDPAWLKGDDEKTLTLAYWDDAKKSWVLVPSRVDTRARTVTAQTTHFTDYGLTTAPDLQGYLPDLSSAQTALFYGAASYRYPIEVPPGRHGFAPQLGLSYSSSGVDMLGPGSQVPFVGAGWSLPTNYLARDTKDTIDWADDLFSLSWNGAGYPLVRDANDATLYHTWSEQYWQIKYESANDRWTITTEDGTQYQLGYSTNSRAVQWRRDGDASHNRAETYAWWLEKAIDPHGNDIAYSYRHDTMTTDCGYAGWGPYTYDAALYPQSIRYNRNASGTYLTEIALDYEARSDHAAITTNTQCGAPMQTLRLKWINVSTSDGATMRAVRKYRLDHDYSTFPGVWHGGANYGRLTLKSITQYGTDGTTALPAQVFTYQNNRLWQVQNGIGGAVSFAYEDIRFDWAARAVQGWDFSGCSGQGWNPCSNEWGPGTANVSMADNAMYIGASGIQYAVLTAPRFIPGIYYRLHAGFRGEGRFKLVGYDGVSEKLIHDWDTPWWCPGCDWGGYFKLDHAASQVSIRIYVDNSIVILNNAWLEMDPTNYRVTGRSISDGQGNTATYSYGYTGAALNHPSNSTAGRFAAGTVSRGHAQVTVTDPTGAKTEHYFKQDDVYQGRLEKVVQLGANGSKFTQAQNTYAARPIPVATVASGDQSNFVYLSQTVHDLYDGQASPVTSKTVYDYDGYGNLSRSDEYSDATTLYRRTLQTYYPPSTALNAQRIINKLKTYQVYIGGATLTQETRYSYDGLPYETAPTKGALYQVQVKTSPNAAFFLQITYGYDTYGNRTSVTDALNHTTTIQYDPIYATIPVAVTRPAPFSFQTVTQYNYRLGKPVTVSDPNSAVTTYEYDGFGRTTKIWLPLQQGHANPTVRYTYALGNPRSLVQVEARADEGLVNSTATYQAAWWFYDGLGRVIQQQARGLNNQTILVNTAYDSRGQTGRVSNPYYAAASGGTYQAPNWGQPFTEHRYDALGRETMTINPDPTIIQTTGYDRRVTRITDANGHWRELTADAFGRTTQVTERNQGVSYNTTYIYDVLNRLWRVTDAAGNQTTMNYDWLGRKASMTDPDLGTWSYGYDNAGNLTRQTDAKNQTTCLYYDELNRLKGQNYQFANSQCANDPNNYTVTNTYDQGTNGIGRRTGLSDPSGTTAWTYDRHGRVTTQTNTIIGAPSAYVTRWTYDAMNRPLSMIYPDGETVPITYNDQGLLATLGTFAATTNDSYNAANQLTQLKLNNGATTTTYIYDSRNLRLTQLTTSGSLQNLSYEYDGVGNVKKITDWVRSEVSTFGYDDLDRLTSASIAGVYSQGWQYNAIGNIIQTTNNGTPTNYTYRYDPNDTTKKPHAVTQVGSSYSVSYDANGNLTARPSGPLQYDAENRLRQVIRGGVTTTYLYDGDGQRVRKIEYSAASVTLTDPFDTSNPALWSWSGYQSVPFNDAGQNVVKSTGTDANWNGNFYRNAYGLTHGQSASIDFKVDSAETYLHLALESSDGGVYSRWALIAAQSKLYVQYNNDGWWIYPQDLINPVKLNTWYRLTLRVDDVNGFRIEVRERDGAGASGGYTRAMPAGKTWRFHSWIYRGTAYLDNYSEQSDNARATYYVGNWYEVTNGAVTKYYYFGGQRVAMWTSAGVTYLHSDHLGSTSVTSGAVSSKQSYYPFGFVRATEGTPPTDYGFTGQKRDSYIKLIQMWARRYVTEDWMLHSPG